MSRTEAVSLSFSIGAEEFAADGVFETSDNVIPDAKPAH